jgi:hypothetical protein
MCPCVLYLKAANYSSIMDETIKRDDLIVKRMSLRRQIMKKNNSCCSNEASTGIRSYVETTTNYPITRMPGISLLTILLYSIYTLTAKV